MDPLQHLPTESRNPASARLDDLSSAELVELMTAEDGSIAAAVRTQTDKIAAAIDAVAERLAAGGRLIYLGAGTSGRLGVLDATECPPTFQTRPEQIVGLIAGGPAAMFRAVEGAEDSEELGKADLEALNLTAADAVFGIATSGRTPYVLGALRYAKSVNALTLAFACNPGSPVEALADIAIVPVVGPEVLTGSTRLKAGTATKLVLNMVSTGAMVRLGKVFGNLMIDVKATNTKLVARANRIVRALTGLDEALATEVLTACNGEVKTALVASLAKVSPDEARGLLKANGGRVKESLVPLPLGGGGPANRQDLVLGIDGGGTTTQCLLADRATGAVIGRGDAGPSNIQSVGVAAGLAALDESIDRAFAAAKLDRATVASACLGLAGVDRQEGLDVIREWAARVGLADTVTVANDATLLLAAGTPDGWGLAVIAGTGSIAFVKTLAGAVGRCGGWGHLLGDEGSAYSIALTALRAACRSFDGVTPPTLLVERFVTAMNLTAAPEFIYSVYRGAWDRSAVAGLAPVVFAAAADGDATAEAIVTEQATELARTAARAVIENGLPTAGLPVAVAGGVLTKSGRFRQRFLAALADNGVSPGPVRVVTEPAVGAVVLARRASEAR